MQQPSHDLRGLSGTQATPRRFVSVGLVAGLHILLIYALATGLAANLIPKAEQIIKAEVVQQAPPPDKVIPPPPPEMVKPPPPFVPPPELNIQTETTNTNAITQVTTQVQQPKPAITAPASVGRPHVCPQERWYPPIAIRMNETGVTTLAFTIGTDGSISNISVAESSGHDDLDQAAVRCAQTWSPYRPAMQNGQPISVPWKAAVRWQLH